MRKMIFISGLFLLIILVGCVENSNISLRVNDNIGSNNLIRQGETFRMEFFVYNPTVLTFTGKVAYVYNQNRQHCLVSDLQEESINSQGGYFTNESIEINPKGQQGVIRNFQYNNNIRYPYAEPSQCINVPIPLTLYVFDKSGLTVASYQTQITILPQ